MTMPIRTPLLVFATCALLAFTAPTVLADDPGEDFPPPGSDAPEAPAKKAPAKKTPAAGTSETPPTGWSPPAVTPGRSAASFAPTDSNLPPPRVLRRRRGTAPIAGMPAARTPVARTPVARQPVPAQPMPPLPPTTPVTTQPRTGAVAITPRTAQPNTTPSVPLVRRPPPPSAAGPITRTGATTGQAGPSGSRIFGVSKLHNVPLDRGPGTEQDLALQLDVDYEVRNQAGRDVYIAVWFARKADGTLVRSAVPAYGDRTGNATLQTRTARVAAAAARYKATLRIPYSAFPMGAGEASYDVEARVQVLRTEASGQVTVLCRGSTTFRVYGFDEGEAPAPAPAPARDDGIPNDVLRGEFVPGTALPGEGGKIANPGR
ncbi:MAG: hypothetical protein P1V36_06035, partial [Planctomycetota bacterium]|nr:hypothetical protein [Planctomycetota bacterium]